MSSPAAVDAPPSTLSVPTVDTKMAGGRRNSTGRRGSGSTAVTPSSTPRTPATPASPSKKRFYDPMKRKRKEAQMLKDLQESNQQLTEQLAAATAANKELETQLSDARADNRSEAELHTKACSDYDKKLADQEEAWNAKLAAELAKKQKWCEEQLREQDVMHGISIKEAIASVKLETTQLYKALHDAELEKLKTDHTTLLDNQKSVNNMLTAEGQRLKQRIAQLESWQRNMIDHNSQLESEKKRLVKQTTRLRAHYHYKNAYKQLLKYTTIKAYVKDKKITKYLYSLVYHLCEEVERLMEIPDIRHALLGMPEFEIWYASYQRGFPIEHLPGAPTADKQSSYQLLQLLVDLGSMYDMMISQVLDLHIHYKNASHSMFERVLSLTNHCIVVDRNLKKAESKCEELQERFEEADGRLRLDMLHQRKMHHQGGMYEDEDSHHSYASSAMRPTSSTGMPRSNASHSDSQHSTRPKTSPAHAQQQQGMNDQNQNPPTSSSSPSPAANASSSVPPIAGAQQDVDDDERLMHFPSRPTGSQSARGPRTKFVAVDTRKRRENARMRKEHRKDALKAKQVADSVYSKPIPRRQKFATQGNRIIGRPAFNGGLHAKTEGNAPFGHVHHYDSRMINSHHFNKMATTTTTTTSRSTT